MIRRILAIGLLFSVLCLGMHQSDCGIDLRLFHNWSEIYGNSTSLQRTKISNPVYVDISSVTITGGLIVESKGWLLIDWNMNITNLNVDAIIVKGKFQIGSSVCPLINNETFNLRSSNLSFSFEGSIFESGYIYVTSVGIIEFWGLSGYPLAVWDAEPKKQSTSVSCSPLDECHLGGVFDTITGECSNPLAPNGTACNDNNTCTLHDVCQHGICVGSPVLCPSQECHESYCEGDTGQCVGLVKPDGTRCNDGNECTLGDTCMQGSCIPQSAVLCSATDQCHNVGTCDPFTGLCSQTVKPNGTFCSNYVCSNTDTCQDGNCVGVICPEGSCKVDGDCIPDNGTMCWDLCSPKVTAAIVSSTITTKPPFAIVFATFATHGATLENGTLFSAPHNGTFELLTDSTQDETRTNTTTQYWTFLYSPLDTCVLDGAYVFRFDMNGWPSPIIEFSFTSHDICNHVTNASAVIIMQLFLDDSYTELTNTFSFGSTIYVAAQAESPMPIEGLELIGASVNGNDFMTNIGDFITTQNGAHFSLPVIKDPFQIDKNSLVFQFKINYSLPLNTTESDNFAQDGVLSSSVKTQIVNPPATPLPSGAQIGNLQPSSRMNLASSPKLLYAVVAVAGFLMLVLSLAIIVLSRKPKTGSSITHALIHDSEVRQV